MRAEEGGALIEAAEGEVLVVPIAVEVGEVVAVFLGSC